MHRKYTSIIQNCLPTVKQTKKMKPSGSRKVPMNVYFLRGRYRRIHIFFLTITLNTRILILLCDIKPYPFQNCFINFDSCFKPQTNSFASISFFCVTLTLSRFWHARCLATRMTMFVLLVSISVANCDCSVACPLTSRNIGHLHVIQTKTLPFFREFVCTCYA